MQLTHLGPYVIEKPLGKGGMGSVYAATDPQTGQRVAIKALTPHLAAAEGFRERFEAEIESLKTLRHDGIVRLYGYGEQDGVLFYSMELVDGVSLEDELKNGRRFNWREVTSIAIQLSHALKHAHDHGIVHRDIKPANILLYDDEHVKLADFGIARLFGTTSLTTAGGVLGTADYMSPEQADGRPVTAKCDQYSLGGVMYALLAGRPPFRAKNLPQMLQLQRFASPEPVRRYAPDTPEQLEHVIAQLLAKDPAARFPNTQVLARHLQAMVNALTRPAADDFSLAVEHPALPQALAEAHESLAAEATQAEMVAGSQPDRRGPTLSEDRTVNLPAGQSAATLAADDVTSRPASSNVRANASSNSVAAAAVAPTTERQTRFTTVEEEELRRRLESKRSWLLVAAQFLSLAAVVAVFAGGAAYLMRPPSAEALYAKIDARADSDDDASLAKVESEIDDFLTRFPDDPRESTLRGYKERIDLAKLERKLRRHKLGVGAIDTSLLPAEQLYLEAAAIAATQPQESLTLFESLVQLYGPADSADGKGSRDAGERTADVVQLAKRRLEKMRPDVLRQREQTLKSMNERLTAAEQLAKTDRQQAIAMYEAIINLHKDDAWAAEVVEKARTRLAELKK
jgi:eukaryotic-like serine/threonine-protein kinase